MQDKSKDHYVMGQILKLPFEQLWCALRGMHVACFIVRKYYHEILSEHAIAKSKLERTQSKNAVVIWTITVQYHPSKIQIELM